VHQADSGSAALELLNDPSVTIDVVLLDFRLPDSNDLSLLARIRQLASNRPVVLMTGLDCRSVRPVTAALRHEART
jgi:DNA-binding response OmpR family regulator